MEKKHVLIVGGIVILILGGGYILHQMRNKKNINLNTYKNVIDLIKNLHTESVAGNILVSNIDEFYFVDDLKLDYLNTLNQNDIDILVTYFTNKLAKKTMDITLNRKAYDIANSLGFVKEGQEITEW